MGCYNGTCGVSQLPIQSGNKVKLVFLKFRAGAVGGSFCYSNELYQPISFPIDGIYNDYGSIEIIDSEHNDIIYNELEQHLKVQADDNGIIINTLAEILSNVCHDEFDGIGYMMIHASIYEDMAARQGKVKHFGTDKYSDIFSRAIDEYLIPCPIGLKYDMIMASSNSNSFTASCTFKALRTSGAERFDIIKKLKPMILEYCMFDIALESSRMFWSVQSGGGSQDSNYDTAILIGKHAKRLKKEYIDWINN